VVVEAEAAARRAMVEVGRRQEMKACMGGVGGRERWRCGIVVPILCRRRVAK